MNLIIKVYDMRICSCKRTIIIDIIIYLSINMSIIWSGLPTITNMIDVGSMVAIADSVVSGVVWYLAMSNQLAIQWVVYTGILMAMVMCSLRLHTWLSRQLMPVLASQATNTFTVMTLGLETC